MNFPIPPSLKNYIGNKAAGGVCRTILNCVPKHDIRFEGFLGSGIISSMLGKCERIFGSDVDAIVCSQWINEMPWKSEFDWIEVENKDWWDAFNYFTFTSAGKARYPGKKIFVFLDPPYLKTTRHDKYDLYNHDWEEKDHAEFLNTVAVRFNPKNFQNIYCMISHPPCKMYDEMLDGWFRVYYDAPTHGGPKRECLYMNYDFGKIELHTYQYWGDKYVKRQAFARKYARWFNKFRSLPYHERKALMRMLNEVDEELSNKKIEVK
ncbi:MAG: hypothetical protein ABL951_04090 [Alphaproteobacteria bacterium]